jgi:hypothetical protein
LGWDDTIEEGIGSAGALAHYLVAPYCKGAMQSGHEDAANKTKGSRHAAAHAVTGGGGAAAFRLCTLLGHTYTYAMHANAWAPLSQDTWQPAPQAHWLGGHWLRRSINNIAAYS